MKALYIDCGAGDQFNLVYGARRLVKRLVALDIAHRYEEFADNLGFARFPFMCSDGSRVSVIVPRGVV